MPHYLLSVHLADTDVAPAPGEWPVIYSDVAAFNAKLNRSGKLVYVGSLMPVEQGRTVTAEGEISEQARVTGPVVLSGLWVIDVEDVEEALSWATKAATAARQSVEVRPFQPTV